MDKRNDAVDRCTGEKNITCVLRKTNGMWETRKNKYMPPPPPALLRTALRGSTFLVRLEILPAIISSDGVSFFFIQQVKFLSARPSQRSRDTVFLLLSVSHLLIHLLPHMPSDFPLELKSNQTP